MNRIKDLSQQRAEFAYREVKAAKDALGDKDGEFKSHVKKVPLMIRSNGLAASFAFVFSKRKPPVQRDNFKGNSYYFIEKVCKDWLKKRMNLTIGSNDSLGHCLAKLERDQYRRVMRELLALFTWLKRFSDGLITKEAG